LRGQSLPAIGWLLACWLLQQLPAIYLVCMLLLWVSLRTGSVNAIFLIMAALFFGYLILAALTGSPLIAQSKLVSPALWQVLCYLDPYAITPLMHALADGTRQASQLSQAGADSGFILNRIVVLGMASALLLASLRRAARVQGTASPGRHRWHRPLATTALTLQAARVDGSQNTNAAYHGVQNKGCSGALAALAALAALLRLQFFQLLRQRSSVIALIVLFILMLGEVVSGLDYAEPFALLKPNSRDALNRVMWDMVPHFGILLLVWWSTRLAWLNQQQRLDELIASTPLASWVLLLSQFLCLASLALCWVALGLLASVLGQVAHGSAPEVTEYLLQALYAGLPLILWSAVLPACHALLRTRLQALLLIGVLLALRLSPLPGLLGLEHPLWQVLNTPLHMADQLWDYQASIGSFWPFIRFWSSFSVFALALGLAFYHRGTGYTRPALLARNQAGAASKRRLSMAAVLAGLLVLLLQGWSLQQLLDADYLVADSVRQARRADYEKQYQHWQGQPQPGVRKVQSQVDFYPQQQRADIQGQLTLINTSAHPIKQILVGRPGNIPFQHLKLDGGKISAIDARLGQTMFTMDQDLLPGQQTELHFALRLQQNGIQPAAMHQVLRQQFSYLRAVPLYPVIGFNPDLRLRDAGKRKQFGLAALQETRPSILFAKATPATAQYDWAQLEALITVPAGMQAVGQGSLLRHWQQQGRSFFHYRTQHPVRNLPAFMALPWPAKTINHEGIPIELFSPQHNAATELSLQAARQTLSWLNQQVGPYPGDALRLVMMPEIESGSSGYALPQLVLLNHRLGVRALPGKDAAFNQVYRRTVHEVAHQWFGHGLGNGVAGDSAFLVEVLAKYVELPLIEQAYGKAGMQALVDYEQQRLTLAQGRSVAATRALLDAEEAHDVYSRATVVFATLRAELGDEVLCQALRQLWQQHRYPGRPASSMDFVRALQSLSPAHQHAMIRHLLLDAVLP
jgi:hypothetical protein